MNTHSRRSFLLVSSGAAAGTFASSGVVEAADDARVNYSTSGLVTGQLKPLKHKEIPGFLSAAQMAPHHTAHYGGALKALVAADGPVVSDEHAIGLLWMAVPLVVIDTYEHAFYIDYQNRKAEYVEKFMAHINWADVATRFNVRA
jgi:superoxide dismutase